LISGVPARPYIKGLPENAPVTHISWEDAGAFCARLSELNAEVPEGYVFRLPTEAEWEHACRMVEPDRSPGDEESSSGAAAVITTPLLSGMHENPGEWCLDLLKLESIPVVDPVGRIEGPYHSLRGGPRKGIAVDRL
jgi:formylglycine-generating enzyme required for sulfatase activity